MGLVISLSLYFFLSGFLDLDDELDVEGGLVNVDWGILVGDGIGVLVDEVLVGKGVGVLVKED